MHREDYRDSKVQMDEIYFTAMIAWVTVKR